MSPGKDHGRRAMKPLYARVLVPASVGIAALAAAPTLTGANDAGPVFQNATTSSPIALSNDNKLLFVVNPDDNSVSVIRTDTRKVVTKLATGKEPQGVAIDPATRYLYTANAAGSSTSIFEITSANPDHFQAHHKATHNTGAEPWNVVTSPDGRRVFVANSGQDTITVIDNSNQRVIGAINLRQSVCNQPDTDRRFQPRGLAVSADNTKLLVTRFLSFVKPGGVQADDQGREGALCLVNINTHDANIGGYQPAKLVLLAATNTGFAVDKSGDGVADTTFAFANQLQSVVIRGDVAYLPNIAASPTGPVRFNTSTQAYVNLVRGVGGGNLSDGGAINLHLGARVPEAGKERLFFANPWGIAFTTQSGAGTGYAISAGSDLLVKVNVDAAGNLSNTVNATTTRYVDLNDPDNPRTSGDNAGKNPLGIVINSAGTFAYTMNFVSRNVSVIDLASDNVVGTIRTTGLPGPGTREEVLQVGAEMFFSSRGNFNRPAGTTVSTRNRLSSEGWQNCASCHFAGRTDGIVWAFGAGPRKSVPLNTTWNPHNRDEQRILNYSAIFDEVEDFENNIRNVSGPGGLNLQGKPAVACADPTPVGATPTNLDPNHGLLIADNGDINSPPCEQNAFLTKANANRPQHTVTLPGSTAKVPALTALKEWVRFAARTPVGTLADHEVPGGVPAGQIETGRQLFGQANCAGCHAGSNFTLSRKDFQSPPNASEVFTERTGTFVGNPVAAQFLARFLRDIKSFNLGVAGGNNPFGQNIGAAEKAAPAVNLVNGALTAAAAADALGIDYNSDGKGIGYNIPSLLGIGLLPPYYHNGSCETLACVLSNKAHRTAGTGGHDVLDTDEKRRRVVQFLESLDARKIVQH